jgi:hypothetical protein
VKSEAVAFLKKAPQKTFAPCGLWRQRCHIPQEQSLFASFSSEKEGS